LGLAGWAFRDWPGRTQFEVFMAMLLIFIPARDGAAAMPEPALGFGTQTALGVDDDHPAIAVELKHLNLERQFARLEYSHFEVASR
jgi:hypothetical protein